MRSEGFENTKGIDWFSGILKGLSGENCEINNSYSQVCCVKNDHGQIVVMIVLIIQAARTFERNMFENRIQSLSGWIIRGREKKYASRYIAREIYLS